MVARASFRPSRLYLKTNSYRTGVRPSFQIVAWFLVFWLLGLHVGPTVLFQINSFRDRRSIFFPIRRLNSPNVLVARTAFRPNRVYFNQLLAGWALDLLSKWSLAFLSFGCSDFSWAQPFYLKSNPIGMGVRSSFSSSLLLRCCFVCSDFVSTLSSLLNSTPIGRGARSSFQIAA